MNSDFTTFDEVFKNVCDALSKASSIIDKHLSDFYQIFTNFLSKEYYHYFENEEIPVPLSDSEKEANSMSSQQQLIER